MKKHIKAFLSFFILFVLAFLFTSCKKTEDESILNLSSTSTEIYTNIEYALPANRYMVREFTPDCDTVSNTITVYAEHSVTFTEDDITVTQTDGSLYRISSDGTILETINIPLPTNTRISAGVFCGDTVYYITAFYDMNSGTHEYRPNSSTGDFSETVIGDDLLKHFGDYDFPRTLCVGGDGNIYIAGQSHIVCLNPDMTVIFSTESDNRLFSMARLRNGSIGICSTFNNGVGLAILDSMGNMSKPSPLTDGTRTLLSVFSENDTYDIYFADSTALWGAAYDEKGELVRKPLMELANSGILNADTAQSVHTDSFAYPVAVFGNSFLFASAGSGEDAGLTPFLYSPLDADNRDVQTQTITVAYAEALSPKIIDKILLFQKSNEKFRIVTKDYSTYASSDDPNAAHEQLAFDIVNGFCTPDIVIGSYGDTEIEQLIQKQLYLDLCPYIDSDNTINFDTLFGCIKRAFDDGNGGMWGICNQFTFRTLISTREMLGEYADNTSWSLSEMLDFLESLPDDTERMPLATKASSTNQFLCNGYGMFIDTENGVCTFDSPLFKRYLTYLMTLPDNAREANKTSEYLKLSPADRYFARASGKVGLEFYSMWGAEAFFEPVCLFGTSDYVPIGFATDGDSGTQIKPDECFIITTFSAYPDICFELIKEFFTSDDSCIEQELYSLKPQMNAVIEHYAENDIVYYFDGGYSFVPHDLENPLAEASLDEPGLIIRFTDEDRDKLISFLDNAGYPIINQTPTAVTDIVEEELSAFFAGQGNADDCAKKIQSRVSIWLSENAG